MQNNQDNFVGTTLANRYEIVSVIGKGGMGVVYRAYQEMMDRYMAIKMLHAHMMTSTEAMQRFLREAKTISQVQHHHIVTLYDFGVTEAGLPYIVMDYLEGVSLKQLLKAEGPIALERAALIFKQIIEGLIAAHSLDVVHRDLKPENIMLTQRKENSDWVILVDFGLSKLKDIEGKQSTSITKVGDIFGSPPYMSPEQCLSTGIIDQRSDIYSLAIVIYEALTNQLPFKAKSAIEMFECHLNRKPPALNLALPDLKITTEITHVLNKALEKEPKNRYQTIEEFGEALQDAFSRDALKLKTMKYRVATLANEIASTGQELPADSEADTCPYCDAPLSEMARFCLECQRPCPNIDELRILRKVQSPQNMFKSRRNSNLDTRDTKLIRLADDKARKLRRTQEVLKVIFAVLLVYAAYVGLNNPTLIKTIEKMATAFHLNGK